MTRKAEEGVRAGACWISKIADSNSWDAIPNLLFRFRPGSSRSRHRFEMSDIGVVGGMAPFTMSPCDRRTFA